jgi:hypothetical protein
MYFVGIIFSSSSEKLLHFGGFGWKGKGVNSTPLSEGSGKARRKMDAKPTPDLGVNWRGSYDKKVSRFSDEPQPKLRKF